MKNNRHGSGRQTGLFLHGLAAHFALKGFENKTMKQHRASYSKAHTHVLCVILDWKDLSTLPDHYPEDVYYKPCTSLLIFSTY